MDDLKREIANIREALYDERDRSLAIAEELIRCKLEIERLQQLFKLTRRKLRSKTKTRFEPA